MGWLSGVFTRAGAVHTGSTIWADSAGDGDATISSSEHDTHDEVLKDGINACVTKDGTNAWTGDLDAGSSYHVTNLEEGTAAGDSTRWNETVKKATALTLDGTTIELNYNGTTKSTLDLASIGSAGEVTLSGSQTITGKKLFTTVTTPITDLRILDTTYKKVNVLTAGGAVAVDTTASSTWYLGNDQAMTLTFAIPAASSDTDLGANFSTNGVILMRNESGHGAITLAVTADDTEEIGSRPTGSTDIYSLVYQVWIMGSTRYVQFTWVSS